MSRLLNIKLQVCGVHKIIGVNSKKGKTIAHVSHFFRQFVLDQYRLTVLRCSDECSWFFFIYFVMVSLVFRVLQVAMVEAQDEAGIPPHHEGDLLFPTSMDSK